jgi:hypothetical protein
LALLGGVAVELGLAGVLFALAYTLTVLLGGGD